VNGVFLDTVGLVAIANVDDQWNSAATRVFEKLVRAARPLVTSSLVLIEVGDGLSRVRYRQLAIDIRASLRESQQIEIVQCTHDLEKRAWDLYAQRPDKDWGMTDCVTMVIMQDRGIASVLTADRHFEQAGYEILLKT
jgi:predicted nucleic acid-binding protein